MSSVVRDFSERSLRRGSDTSFPSKADELRSQTRIRADNGDNEDSEDNEEDETHTTAMEKKTWATFFQRNSVLRTYQKRVVFNSDMKVAILEFAIMILSLGQLCRSYRSSHWREKRACARHQNCIDSMPEDSFIIVNVVRAAIAVLALTRFFIRLHQLWKTKLPPEGILLRFKTMRVLQYALELLYTAILPYPGLEYILTGDRGNVFVALSMSVLLRTISWRQWLYYPYPIRQKEKVASFSGNLDFSYQRFVIKKVLDENPVQKLVAFYALLGAIAAFLLHVMETIVGECTWDTNNATLAIRSEDADCYEFLASDALWMVFMTFLSIGYGDVSPMTTRARVVVAVTACVAVLLDALFFSLIIKKFSFTCMEARVHAFLYRMELQRKKDISAVLAVQATYRHNKSYRNSLIWHQQGSSNTFYRPLSARLPDEVKKKLYVSRFQTKLKEIMQYNTDGDPLNVFSKHVEVITAALGVTFADIIRLKRLYYRRARMLSQRKKQHTLQRITNSVIRPVMALTSKGQRSAFAGTALKMRESDVSTSGLRSSMPNGVAAVRASSDKVSAAVNAAWADEMQRKCDATMALLKKIETDVKSM